MTVVDPLVTLACDPGYVGILTASTGLWTARLSPVTVPHRGELSVLGSLRRTLGVLCLACSGLLLAACGGVSVGYQPPFAPIKISISSAGKISVAATGSIATEYGTFSAEGGVTENLKPESNIYWLTIRHKQGHRLVDTIYQIHADEELTATVNGKTRLDFTDDSCFVDASSGSISSIVIRPLRQPVAIPSASIYETVPPAPINVSGGTTGLYTFKISWTNVSVTATYIHLCYYTSWEGEPCVNLPPTATSYTGHVKVDYDAGSVSLWACRGNICSAQSTDYYLALLPGSYSSCNTQGYCSTCNAQGYC